MFLIRVVVLRKNNLVICEYGVFGLVCYRNNIIGVPFLMSMLSLCLKAKIQGEFFLVLR